MSARVDSSVVTDLARYGGDTVSKCFNCGNCTAACSLTNQDSVFPRRYIRYIQMGLKGKMLESLDPWLCYYCGDCSDTCPREAEPGKLMMAGRRWLISMYDWTGLSRLMYKWPAWELGLLALVAAVVLGLFTIPENFGFRLLANHPEARQAVALAYFAPKEIVHWGDIVMAAILAVLLLSNAARMTYYVMRRSPAVPLSVYLLELKELILHSLTQKRWRECKTDNTKHWLRHVALVSAYGTMFALVVVFLYWFQVEDASFHWTSLLGVLRHAYPAGRHPLDRPRPMGKAGPDSQAQRPGRLALRGTVVPHQPDRHPAPPVSAARPAYADLRHVRGPPHGRRSHAGG